MQLILQPCSITMKQAMWRSAYSSCDRTTPNTGSGGVHYVMLMLLVNSVNGVVVVPAVRYRSGRGERRLCAQGGGSCEGSGEGRRNRRNCW